MGTLFNTNNLQIISAVVVGSFPAIPVDRVPLRHHSLAVKCGNLRGPERREDGKRARADGRRARVDGKRARVDGKRARADGKRARVDGKRARVDGKRARVDGKRARVDGKRARVDGKRARADGSEERPAVGSRREAHFGAEAGLDECHGACKAGSRLPLGDLPCLRRGGGKHAASASRGGLLEPDAVDLVVEGAHGGGLEACLEPDAVDLVAEDAVDLVAEGAHGGDGGVVQRGLPRDLAHDVALSGHPRGEVLALGPQERHLAAHVRLEPLDRGVVPHHRVVRVDVLAIRARQYRLARRHERAPARHVTRRHVTRHVTRTAES
eukprot:1189839-Prorocentrum_minimum.AAC.2